jgi:hypothetical protein
MTSAVRFPALELIPASHATIHWRLPTAQLTRDKRRQLYPCQFGDDERRKRIRLLLFEERDVSADRFLEEVEKRGIKIAYAMQ